MSISSRLLTYADLERARETRDDRLELIEGEIYVTPSPTPMHQLVVLRLAGILEDVIVDSGLGVAMPAPLDVRFSPFTVLQPDFVILVDERAAMFERGKIDAPPSLAIEILSPSTGERDRNLKRDVYAQFGVPEYWIVDLEDQSVTSFSDPVEGRYRSQRTMRPLAISITIPTLVVDLAALFASPRRFQR